MFCSHLLADEIHLAASSTSLHNYRYGVQYVPTAQSLLVLPIARADLAALSSCTNTRELSDKQEGWASQRNWTLHITGKGEQRLDQRAN